MGKTNRKPDRQTTTTASNELKKLALKIQAALNARQRAETCVIVSTLALEGQLSDFDNRIAESLKGNAWDGLYEIYAVLHEAMHLIPEEGWPEGFTLDTGALSPEVSHG